MVAALLQLSYQRFPSLAAHRVQELEVIRLSLDGLKKRFPSAIGAERVINQMMKNSPTLLDTRPSPRMTLTSEQREFFAPFGPELCRMWPLVMESHAPFMAGIGDFAGASHGHGHAHSTTINADQTGRQGVQSNGSIQTQSVPAHLDPLWPSDTSLLFPNDDQALFSNEQALDSVGRWWWADWVPEADLDFLSKSL